MRSQLDGLTFLTASITPLHESVTHMILSWSSVGKPDGGISLKPEAVEHGATLGSLATGRSFVNSESSQVAAKATPAKAAAARAVFPSISLG